MMLKQLQKKLDLNWIKKNKIWDIGIYGSYNRGRLDAKDIDIAIILNKITPVKKKMMLCQEFRHMISEEGYVFDVKAVDINDLLNIGFLGREAVFAESYSLLKEDYIAERFGFIAVTLFQYGLKGLTPSKQKMFYYALQGRKKGTGVLARVNGRIISKGVLEIPTKSYEEIKDLFNQHNINYSNIFTLRYRILH